MMNLRWSLFFFLQNDAQTTNHHRNGWTNFFIFLLLLFKLDCLINSLAYIELGYNEINKSLVVIWWWWEIIVIIIIISVVVVVVKLILKNLENQSISHTLTHTHKSSWLQVHNIWWWWWWWQADQNEMHRSVNCLNELFTAYFSFIFLFVCVWVFSKQKKESLIFFPIQVYFYWRQKIK